MWLKTPQRLFVSATRSDRWIGSLLSAHPVFFQRWDYQSLWKKMADRRYFKTCKTYLNLVKECHRLSFDALAAYTLIFFTKYLMIDCKSCLTRMNVSLERLFLICSQVGGYHIQWIVPDYYNRYGSQCLLHLPAYGRDSVSVHRHIASCLPEYIWNSLSKSTLAR